MKALTRSKEIKLSEQGQCSANVPEAVRLAHASRGTLPPANQAGCNILKNISFKTHEIQLKGKRAE